MVRRRTKRANLPKCAGHYVEGHKECDGSPCAWRVACKIYRDRAEQRAMTIGVTRADIVGGDVAEFGMIAVERHLWGLEQKFYMAKEKNPYFAFNLFSDGVRSVLPVVERKDANSGDYYFTTPIRSATGAPIKGHFKRALMYMVAKGRSEQYNVTLTIAEYLVRKPKKFWPPRIKMAIDLQVIESHYPAVMGGAITWRHHRKTRWTVAAGVKIKRVPDIGRMIGTACREGHTFQRIEGHYGDMTAAQERAAIADRAKFIAKIRSGRR